MPQHVTITMKSHRTVVPSTSPMSVTNQKTQQPQRHQLAAMAAAKNHQIKTKTRCRVQNAATLAPMSRRSLVQLDLLNAKSVTTSSLY